MATRKGRRIALVTVLAVVLLGGALTWLGREHVRFALAVESPSGPAVRGCESPRAVLPCGAELVVPSQSSSA